MFEDITINKNMMPEGHADRPGTKMKTMYVTVHDVGGTNASENGRGISNYCNQVTQSSWHFTVGNDGPWQQLPMDEVGWHAGDGTSVPLQFTDTGVKATSNDAAVVTISSDGYFEMNGQKTTIKAPTKDGGALCKTSDLPYTGINNYVDATTGTYWIGNTWWSCTYKTLANRGGNLNSVGIETCINEGSNVFYTWNITAKLIGEIILPQNGIEPKDVKQHNTFSGKNCPQTMRTANMWETFMEIVETEYLVYKYFRSWDIEFICDSPYIGANGLIKGLPDAETTINYQIKVNDKMGYEKTFDFSFVLPARAGYRV
jgi:N-acetylmuramoyl-L-alanine amidase CwlA